MSTLWSDLKFGVRMVRKAPGASLIAALALGLGIGANTAIFSIANGILRHPLPYAHLERLMFVGERPPHNGSGAFNSVSAFNYAAWQKQATVFEAFTASRYDQMNLGGVGTPAMVQGAQISPNFFSVLPARLIRGRAFLPEEGQPGHGREVILSQALWQHQFSGDPGIIGKNIELDQQAFTVVGIVGEDAVWPQASEVWMPLVLTPKDLDNRTDHNLRVVGLLRPGATLEQASAEMNAIAQRIDAAHPDTNRDWGVNLESLADREIGNQTAAYVYLLLGATGFLLLIACANVANLQFARALGRNHELAIRTALGAGRGRLMRQLLGENLVLGLGGAAVGVAFAAVSIRLILAYMPADVAVFIGGWDRVRLNGAALAFTLAIALLAGIVAGLAPAWHASRPDLNSTLKEGGRGAIGHSRRRLRAALVAMQVALALVLLVGAGLMVKGFNATLNVDQGWEPAATLTAAVNLPGTPQY
ncbi:MAG: ABC transporter permease, partial [Streptosporangiaceae bacterium]